MAVNDVYRLTVEASLAGQQIVSVLHYQVTVDPVGAADADDLITAYGAATHPAWIAAMHTAYTFIRRTAQRVNPAGPAVFVSPYAGGTTGTRAVAGQDPLPPNVSASITKRTALAGRWARGRMQIAGAFGSDVTLGRWEAAYMGLLNSLAAAHELTVSLGGVSWRPVIYSTQKNKLPVVSTTPIIACDENDVVRVQRSRTVGVGS